MNPVKQIRSKEISELLATAQELFGQFAAVSYAQRIVGKPETGTLTPIVAELLNAISECNFLRYYRNLLRAHVAATTVSVEKKAAWTKQLGL